MLTWSGVIAMEGVPTGDGRLIADGALTWLDGPMPLRFVEEDEGGHDGAVVVGAILTVERQDGGVIYATGVIDDSLEEGAKAAYLVANQLQNGVSIDPDEVTISYQGPEGEPPEDDAAMADMTTVLTAARIRAATLVAIPAFAEAKIMLDEGQSVAPEQEDDMPADQPVDAPVDQPVDNTAASKFSAIRAHETGTDDSTWDSGIQEPRVTSPADEEYFGNVYAWKDDEADLTVKSSYKFIHHFVAEDGTPGDASTVACSAGIAVLNGGRGGTTIPDADRQGVYDHLAKHLVDAGKQPPALMSLDEIEAELAKDKKKPMDEKDTAMSSWLSIVASAPVTPPAEWFRDPGFSGPTKVRVEGDHVFGHLATWGTCHIGFGEGRCVQPPVSHAKYAYFATGTILADDGTEFAVGTITMDGPHADKRLSGRAAAAHYDVTCFGVADVAVGEDEFGIWISGAMRPGVSDEAKRVLRASSLSGDWRKLGGELELVAALAVNVPGFPIVETHLAASGCPDSLIATGLVFGETAEKPAPSKGVVAAADALAARIGRDKASRKAELIERVKG